MNINFGPNGLSDPAGAFTCIKSEKMCIKSEGKYSFMKHAPNDQSDDISASIKEIVPKGCLPLPLGYIYMYEIKQNII